MSKAIFVGRGSDSKPCDHCGKTMHKGRQARKQWDARRYCSHTCANLAGACRGAAGKSDALATMNFGDGPFAALLHVLPIPSPNFTSIAGVKLHACRDHNIGF